MWRNLLAAFGLMLVLEGILPFLNPRGFKNALTQLLRLPDRPLRLIGLGGMLLGLVILYLLRD